MDLPDTPPKARRAISTFELDAPIRAQISPHSLSRHLHVPMPPETDPDPDTEPNTPPPGIDPEPIPDDPVGVPHEAPEGDPPAAPPPVHAYR